MSVVASGNVTLGVSGPWELVTLGKVFTSGLPESLRWPTPCARSYERNEWEVVLPRAPGAALVQITSCSRRACTLLIPDDPDYTYIIHTTDVKERHGSVTTANTWHDRSASQLLTQATFGPTRDAIANLSSRLQAGDATSATFGRGAAPPPTPPAMTQWVLDQMTAQPTLHRSYIRKHANPRQEFLSDLGRPRSACEIGARWSRIAIRADDISQALELKQVAGNSGTNVTALYINGVLRSEVRLSELRPWGVGATQVSAHNTPGALELFKTYKICRVDEWEQGRVIVGDECISGAHKAAKAVHVLNVFISLTVLSYPRKDHLDEHVATWKESHTVAAAATFAPLQPATEWNDGVLLLKELHGACPLSIAESHKPSTTLKHGGLLYRYDPRLVILDNTVDAPASISARPVGAGFGEPTSTICPSAPKTFLNEHTCVMTQGCLPYSYSAKTVVLNPATLRAMFAAGHSIIFAVDHLPLNPGAGLSNDPCKQTSRWRSLDGRCDAHGGATTLPSTTREFVVQKLRSSTDANLIVRDIHSTDMPSTCSKRQVEGAKVDVDGVCWQNTNERNLNVYDFTTYANSQHSPCWDEARQSKPLRDLALNTNTTTIDLYAWFVRCGLTMKLSTFGRSGIGNDLVGKMGDKISFAKLPTNIRTPGFAEALGVTISYSADTEGPAAVEMCGSPGETSTDPFQDAKFNYNNYRFKSSASNNQQENFFNHRVSDVATPSIAHTMAALYQPDQLRQRVAWALSQVVVAAKGGIGSSTHDLWTTFYDIFVRHAFGSYRHVLQEASYSPVMSAYLTSLDNKARHASGTVPDENYAREIMQLFSVGLWMLEPDGTQSLDANGRPIPTYVNDDIVEQARIWTGLTTRDIRGNVEIRRNPERPNQIDPVKIREEWRDVFPKRDLYGGHIGDGYPLCTDLGSAPFLRAGAKYRYLGIDHTVPELSEGIDWSRVGGATSSSAPPFEPEPSSSALYAALCDPNGAGQCRFKSNVVLGEHTPCDGVECTMDTVRLVKVTHDGVSYYFEHLPLPCVSLGFLEGGVGKYIENFQQTATQDRICAEPKAAVASPACCVPFDAGCFEIPCSYVEERVSYHTALNRCEDWYHTHHQSYEPEAETPQLLQRVASTKVTALQTDELQPSGLAMRLATSGVANTIDGVASGANVSELEAAEAVKIAAIAAADALEALPIIFTGPSYVLFPFEYKVAKAACPDGTHSPSEVECYAAATRALAEGAEPHFDAPTNNRGELYVGSWNDRPMGCVISTHRKPDVYYNRAASTTVGSLKHKLVCTAANMSFPQVANMSASGGWLCPRKKQSCQTLPSEGHGCVKNERNVRYRHNSYWWSEESCRVQAQVHLDGRVAVVHPSRDEPPLGASDSSWFGGVDSLRDGVPRYQSGLTNVSNKNWFRVGWAGNEYPSVSNNCSVHCIVIPDFEGGSCLCEVDVVTAAVYTAVDVVPTATEVRSALKIGSAPPEHFDDGIYIQCTSAPCRQAKHDVEVYVTQGTATRPIFDDTTIFAVHDPLSGDKKYFSNKGTAVYIAQRDASKPSFSFRNPPQFMTLVDETERDAMYETEALLDHLFYHPNVAPFVAIRLIQRLVSSNPSPRYVAAATAAFRSGIYEGRTFSGRYGDLGAMVAAILLDREARSLILNADPTHGHVREPFVRLLHLMRAMEATPRANRELAFRKNLNNAIGQMAYHSPSVFNFFQPEFAPEGPVADVGLVAPEAQLGVATYSVRLMGGLTSLLFDGMTSCLGGLFSAPCDTSYHSSPEPWKNYSNDGYLAYSPSGDAADPAVVIDELDLLLTAGRLDEYTKAIVVDEYSHALNRSACPVDRSAELCGRLTPGQSLNAGESITNSLGETLCFTYDGVARHIDASGREIFSTAVHSREVGETLHFSDRCTLGPAVDARTPNACLKIVGPQAIPWKSNSLLNAAQASFGPFLAGPCDSFEAATFKRFTAFEYRKGGGSFPPVVVQCNAADTCAPAIVQPPVPTAAYRMRRAKTDAEYAVRVASNVIASSAAFATTNEPSPTLDEVQPKPARAYLGRPYKALVVFFMRGGADTFNMLVPKGDCDERRLDRQYKDTRGAVALISTLEISSPNGTQPCGKFGVHESLPLLRRLYEHGDAAFVANAGSLIAPITKEQYLRRQGTPPPQLFAHNTMQNGAESLHPQMNFASGIAGRILTALEQQGTMAEPAFKTGAYSLTTNKYLFRGSPIPTIVLDPDKGANLSRRSSPVPDARRWKPRRPAPNLLLLRAECTSAQHAQVWSRTRAQPPLPRRGTPRSSIAPCMPSSV